MFRELINRKNEPNEMNMLPGIWRIHELNVEGRNEDTTKIFHHQS